MLPEPNSTFTIPSIHDDTQLECRIYHPKHGIHSAADLETKAVIIAHPYTPMGGCFDDHVLHAVGLEFLKHGYLLGLFNLRGAGASKGSTSWTSKPEQDDYSSFVGFLLCYLDELHRRSHESLISPSSSSMTPQVADCGNHSQSVANQSSPPTRESQRILVLGGYSYGSQIVRQMPNIMKILAPFSEPILGSAAAEIGLRAVHLAQERRQSLQSAKLRGRSLKSETSQLSPVHGGEESQPGTRRTSRESRRSRRSIEDVLRNSLERSRGRLSRNKARDEPDVSDEKSGTATPDHRNITVPEVRYLLISPLLPPLSSFLALSPSLLFRPTNISETEQQQLSRHDSLAVWGTKDAFTSSKRLRKWASALQRGIESRFTFQEIDGAGHFWLEIGKEVELLECVRGWLNRLDV